MIIFSLLAIALSPTPTITPTSVPTPASEIQKIRELVQQKVGEKLKQITQPSAIPRGVVGNIIQADAAQFSIEYPQGNVRTVKFDANTVFIDSKHNKSSSASFKIGQDILAMGVADDVNSMTAERIVNIDLKSITNIQRVIVVGKIVDISKASPIFALIPSKNKDLQYQIKTDNKTEIVNLSAQKIATTDLHPGQKIITILTPDEKIAKTYYAQKIINLDYTPPVTPTLTPKPTKKQ